MAFLVSSVITRAFYLANILSAQSDQTTSTAQDTQGLDLLNNILDSLQLQPTFSSFITQYDITATTHFIFLGLNVTSSDSDVTVINNAYLNTILTASVFVGNVRNPLEIHNLSELNGNYIVDAEGIPQYLYYDIEIDSNDNIFDKIYLQPSAVTTYTITLRGIKGFEQHAADTENIVPTFTLFLTYELASVLADFWGKTWSNQKETKRQALYNTIINLSPIDTSIVNNDMILKRGGYYYITTSSA